MYSSRVSVTLRRLPSGCSGSYGASSSTTSPSARFSITILNGRTTAITRGEVLLRSSRSACSSSETSTTLSRVETPTLSQRLRSAAGVNPRRRSPASVGMRGSSQPLTCLPCTSSFIRRLLSTVKVNCSLANSICTGRASAGAPTRSRKAL